MSSTKLTGATIAEHNSRDSCWVIVHGKAYDVTDFLNEHPGGSRIILRYAGKDATDAFDPVHPPDTLNIYLDPSKHLGYVDMETIQKEESDDPEKALIEHRIKQMPPLEACYNLMDFETVAREVMRKTSWAYYSSGADDEITMRENHSAFHKVWFRPRVLVDVESVDMSTTMLGTKVSIPFYVTATALGKLGHPEGEVVLTKAAYDHDVIHLDITERIVRHAEQRGCKAVFITVDAPQLGRREKDMRSKFSDVESDVQASGGSSVDRSQGAARAISSFIDPSLSWKDIPWFKSITKMPIILKGVQCVDDVLRAIDIGVDSVVISNHGGRQLDTTPSAIEILAEVAPILRARGLEGQIEIYIDGGIRRATDIIKALCLGAKGVGIGRPFLYAMSAYGAKGVSHAMQLLKDEMEMNMRLIGAACIKDLNPSLVDTRGLLSGHSGSVPVDSLSLRAYDSLQGPRFGDKSKL
ncbi:FMN-dependent dehydrogenase-domain-containing protein [Penicillium cataractarum]|uniref:FMN-dependent dehydrogenase-domain-containing protein n=1 Tax=Penicillium cataractarum TaxID=2100454 RepID=A0A9W9S2J6_9EURO|nr:FMN-dependent dehydrogenase-domain-containing protein [Penicillium cataractarum]KAJ5368413.1 FMN-dependent dehydrogenase-domain-containing protein [Penicillium cataractarum]